MLINVATPLKNYKGEPILVEGVETTAGLFIAEMLNLSHLDVRSSPQDKLSSYKLSVRIYNALNFERPEIELSAEEIVLIKEKAGAYATVSAYGSLLEIIDPVSYEKG